jgi:hypothetical protein
MLTSLDGIQYLPLLQTLDARNNKITSVKVPQTFFKQKSIKKEIDKNETKASLVRAGSLKKANFSSIVSAPSTTSISSEASKDASVTVLGLQSLTELSLSHNLITSLDGFNSLGAKIEILDIEYNNLDLSRDKDEQLKMITCLRTLTQLNELRFNCNASSNLLGDITAALFKACPSMKSFNGQTVTGLTLSEINEGGKNNEDNEVLETAAYSDDSDEETTYGRIETNETEIEKEKPISRKGSRSAIKVLTIDDVSMMDHQFKHLLSTCKDTLSVMLTLADRTATGDVSTIENIPPIAEKVDNEKVDNEKVDNEKVDKEKVDNSTKINFDADTTEEKTSNVDDSKSLRKSFTFLSEYNEEVEERFKSRSESGATNRSISKVGQDPLPCPPAKRPDSKGDLRY